MTMPYRPTLLLLALACITFANEPSPVRLVEIGIAHHDEVYALGRQGLTVVDAGPDFVRVLADDAEIATLTDAGYRVVILIEDYQAYQDELFQRGFYRTYDQVYAALDSFTTAYPAICRLDTIGYSVLGRAIWAMRVTDDPANEEHEPEIRLIGNIHGDEHIGTEVTLYFLRYLLTGYATDPQIQALIDNNEFWILPTINPDGKVANTRRNANNVDLNRDNGYFWDAWGNSPAPMSQFENRVVARHLAENDVVLEYNYHSAAQYVNYPWDYHQADPPDSQHIITLSQIYAGLSNLFAINGYDWYQITGSLQDYTIGTSGAFAWTIETLQPSAPSSIDQICYNNRDALLDICGRTGWGVHGTVKDSVTGAPLYARIEFTNPERIDIYNDPQQGDFHKMLEPGTYTLRVSANGYAPRTLENIEVPALTNVPVGDVLLAPDTAYHCAFRVDITRYAAHDEQGNKTQPRHGLGPADGLFFSLGQNGYIVVDMGPDTPVYDAAGNDFTVIEGNDNTAEGYEVFASNDGYGPWLSCGSATGTADFDLATAGLTTARYVRIVDDGSYSTGTYAGFDLDAVEALCQVAVAEGFDGPPPPARTILAAPQPNPTDHRLVLDFQMAAAGFVSLRVHDALGRCVATLVNGPRAPGNHTLIWYGVDDLGRNVPAGVYFVRLEADDVSQVEKAILFR